jgi:glycosyltransferase involved in cell wall biosynthesis
MRLLLLNYEFPPLGGGAAHATYNLLKEFTKVDNLEIDVVVSSPDNEFRQIEFSKHITVYKLPINKKSGGIHYQTNKDLLIYSHKASRFIKNLLREKKYHLCHAFFGVPCGYVAYRFRKCFPYIVSLRGSDIPGYNLRFSTLYKFITPTIKRVWHNARVVVANSQGLKELALKTDPQQTIGVIYNGIDTQLFKPTGSKDSVFRILCVARLIERKGIKYLIEAADQLIKQYKNVELMLVGKGNIENELKNEVQRRGIAKQVKFMGFVAQADLPHIYNLAKVFVLPSLNEGMSNTVLEAMACGLPIVATVTGGTAELVKDNGFTIPMREGRAIYETCLKLIEDEELRQKMGDKSREIAESMSWQKIAAEYINIYKRCIAS